MVQSTAVLFTADAKTNIFTYTTTSAVIYTTHNPIIIYSIYTCKYCPILTSNPTVKESELFIHHKYNVLITGLISPDYTTFLVTFLGLKN